MIHHDWDCQEPFGLRTPNITFMDGDDEPSREVQAAKLQFFHGEFSLDDDVDDPDWEWPCFHVKFEPHCKDPCVKLTKDY